MSTPKIIVIGSFILIVIVFAWIVFELFVRPPMEAPKTDFIYKESPLNESPATPAKEAPIEIYQIQVLRDADKEAPIEIYQIRVLRDADGERKTTHSVSFSIASTLKPGTILDVSMNAITERLSGSKPVQVAKESVEIKDGKFTMKLSLELVLPPCRYYLAALPSETQKDKSISFSKEDQLRLNASKYVVIGTVAERLEFMQEEYRAALKYAEELDDIYKEFQRALDESKENGKPPTDDTTFQKWQKDALAKVRGVDREIAVLVRNQGYLTFYPSSFSKLSELAAILESQLKQFKMAVIMANKSKETDFRFTIHSRVPGLLSDTKTFLTKETLLNLSWFYYALTEDTVVVYEGIKDSPYRLKDWQVQEAVCDEYFMKSDEFISGFKPLVDDIWKKNIDKVSDSQDIVRKINEIYRAKINGDNDNALTKRLEKLKKNIGEILYNLRTGLNK